VLTVAIAQFLIVNNRWYA